MSRRIDVAAVLVMAIAAVTFSCAEESGNIEVNEGLDARVADSKFTTKDIDDKLEQISPQLKSKYKGREGRADFVDDLIREELIYLAALETDLKYDEDVKAKIRRAEKSILTTAYYDKMVRQKVEVTDDEIESYYDLHWDEFMNRAIMKASHMFTEDRAKAEEWRERLDNGENFNKIAKTESEDRTTAMNNGNLGYFNPGGYVKFYGASEEFSDQIKDLEIGDISDVVVTEKGFSIVKITDKKPESLKPLSEVRLDILDKIRGEKAKVNLEKELARLNEKYKPVNFVREDIMKTTRSPEELWQIAQEEDAYYTRITYYRHLVNKYPEHKYAPQALFMIGFVYAEEVQDLVQARRTFDELLREYPDSEVAESARWMIDNLEKPHPKFESVDDMKEKMDAEEKGQD